MDFNSPRSYPEQVEIIEVGPRDGLQREETIVSVDDKVRLIEDLVAAGLKQIQVASFVHPKLVPQMADAEQVCARLPMGNGVTFSGLALNGRGVERARDAGLQHVDISVSVNDAHSRRNSNMSVEESLMEFKRMYQVARQAGMTVRGGIQCAFGYMHAGDVEPGLAVRIARLFLDLGVDELTLADSSGVANPRQVGEMLDELRPLVGETPLVMHFHDTRGMGLANLLAALGRGVNRFDTAFGGLGGCPFIDGAAGNIATEDTVHMLHQMGLSTGVDLHQMGRISRRFETLLGKGALPGKVYGLAVEDGRISNDSATEAAPGAQTWLERGTN